MQATPKDSCVEYRRDPILVVVRIENGTGTIRSKSIVMRQHFEPGSGLRADVRFVILSVLVLVIFAALGAVYHWLWPRLSALLPIFFAGLVGIGIGVLACKVPEMVQASREELPPVDPSDVEVDLRSISPIEAQVVSGVPQLSLALRVTNFLSYDITVTGVSATVAFSQVAVEMSLKRAVDIAAYTTGQDIILRQPLEGPLVAAIDAFFARKEDLSRCVNVNVELNFDCDAGSFRRRPENIQRYLPEILTIRRWPGPDSPAD